VTLPQRNVSAGPQSLAWVVRSLRAGRYELRVTAQNEIGATTLSAPFAVLARR
jgi:hypothetical protein